MGTLVFSAAAALVMAIFFVVELRTGHRRHGESLYLVSRVARRHGLELREKPLSLAIPWSRDSGVVHFHLLRPGGERDSITLIADFGGRSRLGNLVIDNTPSRMLAAGLDRLALGVPQLDSYFRIFSEPDRQVLLVNLLGESGDLLRLVKDLSCRSRQGRLELVDLGGKVKIQFTDRSLRFPSDVEEVTLGLLRLYQLYLVLAGVGDVRDVPAGASPVTP